MGHGHPIPVLSTKASAGHFRLRRPVFAKKSTEMCTLYTIFIDN